MKIHIFFFCCFFSFNAQAQNISWEDWNQESKINIRLIPKYGHIKKTDAQKASDQNFIQTVLKQKKTLRAGSEHLVSLGFKYLYQDVKTAMYRFNQAYLLDSTNTDIYWGYGAVYMVLGRYEKAKEQYKTGLNLAPENTNLLTDYGTYYMGQYYALAPIDKEAAVMNLDSAIELTEKSYSLNPSDMNTTYKLSILYWNKGDCTKAWKFINACKKLGGQPITESYMNDLKAKCPIKQN